MRKRGKTPSLIGGGAGAVKPVSAKRKRTCKRCDHAITQNTQCWEVKYSGGIGHKTYCVSCFREILDQTQNHLDSLRNQVN